eukprot:CAMPEP_0195516630 /NCGR_PEP_ID=MMETSP0794_2-20130614/8084_1 /TAXON_ID=515487 /ORGANISM="Stephanopyxis turris, Strain CCMP 815" /LENGTH=287 /DNA_ID=CAMNT_0040645277 /DNA_START=93 /DNA_END=956 /DNA_ORIENTATION=-
MQQQQPVVARVVDPQAAQPVHIAVNQQPVQYVQQQPVQYVQQQPVQYVQQPVQYPPNPYPQPQLTIVNNNAGGYPSVTISHAVLPAPWCCALKCTLVTSQVFGVFSVILAVTALIVSSTSRLSYVFAMAPGFPALFIAMFVAGIPATASGCCLGCSHLGCAQTCCRRPGVMFATRPYAIKGQRVMIAAYSVGVVAWLFMTQNWSCLYTFTMCMLPSLLCIVTCCLALSSACLFAKDMQQRANVPVQPTPTQVQMQPVRQHVAQPMPSQAQPAAQQLHHAQAAKLEGV